MCSQMAYLKNHYGQQYNEHWNWIEFQEVLSVDMLVMSWHTMSWYVDILSVDMLLYSVRHVTQLH